MTEADREARSRNISRNTIGLFVFRAFSFASNILLVPLSLKYLGTTEYGLWIALSSVGGWMGVLDLGIGNGLRNKLSESIALGDAARSRAYISSAYFALGLLALSATILIVGINFFLDWSSILNAPAGIQTTLVGVAAVVFSFLGLRLALGVIYSILLADQHPSLVSLLDALGAGLTLLSVYLLTLQKGVSLLGFAVLSSLGPVTVLLGASVYLFSTKYKPVAPRWHALDLSVAREMASLGIKFFVLQIAGLVIFSSTGIVIARLFGPDEVARYAVAQRYFGIPLSTFGILLTPYWSAYTQAYVVGDRDWIHRSIVRLKLYLIGLALGIFAMILIAGNVYRAWIGSSMTIPLSLSFIFGVYVLVSSWCGIHVNLINGAGKVRLQMIVGVASAILFLPIALLVPALGVSGSTGVMLAVCIVLAPSCILWPIQVRHLLSGEAAGIWGQ
jgi:O-antigen/teichoic acid export membrane protein